VKPNPIPPPQLSVPTLDIFTNSRGERSLKGLKVPGKRRYEEETDRFVVAWATGKELPSCRPSCTRPNRIVLPGSHSHIKLYTTQSIPCIITITFP